MKEQLYIPIYADNIGQQLYDLFVTPRNLIIIGMSWGLTLIIGKILPNKWLRSYKSHISPAIMLCICSTMVWISGTCPDIKSIGWRVSLGVILAVVSMIVPIIFMWLAEKYLPDQVVKSIRKILM